jgi:two-component system cell cycle response regulator
MVDVDHFKSVNDKFGHAAGDRALRLIAEALRVNTRVFDSVARYGGEEFVVVMPGTDQSEATAAAERLRVAVENVEYAVDQTTCLSLTVSIGVACCGAPLRSLESLLQAADIALYEAKRSGRNQVKVAPRAEVI